MNRRESASQGRIRIVAMVRQLPDAVARAQGTHLSLEVRNRRFGWFLDDHHGDGRIALHCKSSAAVREEAAKSAPAQFHLPKYLSRHGWVGLWLDVGNVDWEYVESVMREAWRLTAPKSLLAELERQSGS